MDRFLYYFDAIQKSAPVKMKVEFIRVSLYMPFRAMMMNSP